MGVQYVGEILGLNMLEKYRENLLIGLICVVNLFNRYLGL